MKTQNLIMTLLLSLLWTGTNFAQSFQQTIYQAGIDFNHYSIEQTSAGGIICAGTIFDSSTGYSDMHVMHMNAFGGVIWQKTISITNYDRILDVVVSPTYEIAITGYVGTTIGGVLTEKLYIARLNPSGNIIADNILSLNTVTVGTNIIYSTLTGNYIVGGFYSGPLSNPLVGNKAILVEFDMSLNVVNCMSYATGNTSHSSINDIIEIPGGYFATGSVGLTSGGEQGVLAIFTDDSFNITADISFESTNIWHVGVSAVYDTGNDEVFLMSNNSVTHNPEIAKIVDIASGSPYISIYNTLLLDPTLGGTEASGYQLMICPWDPTTLVACGYFKHVWSGPTPNNSFPWMVQFDPNTGAQLAGLLWTTNSQNYASHGGSVFSNFNGVNPHGYIFNQEILIERGDGLGLIFVGPRKVGPNFGIDLSTTNYMSPGTCLSMLGYTPAPKTWVDISVTETVESPTLIPVSVAANNWMNSQNVYCAPEGMAPLLSAEETLIIDELLTVSPNPFNNNFTVVIKGENIQGSFTISNTMGQIVYESVTIVGSFVSTEINAEQFENGIYIISYTNSEGISKTQKVVKV
ncbi:MAG: hypothetical protein ACI8ZM_004910 [Crocinitomix sp.]|jgi:hypothetical protein